MSVNHIDSERLDEVIQHCRSVLLAWRDQSDGAATMKPPAVGAVEMAMEFLPSLQAMVHAHEDEQTKPLPPANRIIRGSQSHIDSTRHAAVDVGRRGFDLLSWIAWVGSLVVPFGRRGSGDAETVLRRAFRVLDDAPCLNMSNYDEHQVAEVNDAAVESWSIMSAYLDGGE